MQLYVPFWAHSGERFIKFIFLNEKLYLNAVELWDAEVKGECGDLYISV